MICYITWKILDLQATKIEVLLESWIAYELGISEINYAQIKNENKEFVELFVSHQINENSQSLYWFLTREEKQVFEELIKISWVWGKVALLILSLGIDNLALAVVNEDKKVIEQVKWIWKKMAEKIILELKDKDFIKQKAIFKQEQKEEKQIKLDVDIIESVKNTLWNMGYNPKDVQKALEELPDDFTDLNDILPWVIRKLG